jgi:hypothetical protein
MSLSGQMGEALVVAELGRLGIVATSFAGNVRDIDILAYANGKSLPIQVKAQKLGNPGVNATKYLNIQLDGDIQSVKSKVKGVNRKLIYVLVKIGAQHSKDEFYIFTQGVVQDLVNKEYPRYLKQCEPKGRPEGRRPRNPETTHCSYYLEDLQAYKNNWELITDKLV